MMSNKDLEKADRGALDYRSDSNSAVIVVKWVDNKIVQLASNYAGIEPMGTIQRWDKTEKLRKEIQCPSIVTTYNKSMGGVDLADMLIALYRIKVKTKRWYIKVFLHLVDICKVNAWNMYCRHYNQLGKHQSKRSRFVSFPMTLVVH